MWLNKKSGVNSLLVFFPLLFTKNKKNVEYYQTYP